MAIDTRPQSNSERNKVTAKVGIDGVTFDDINFKEAILSENLLTPGLQTAVVLQSFIHSRTVKNFDQFKDKNITIILQNGAGKTATISQRVYRLDNRAPTTINLSPVEEFTVHACDPSLLEDARSLVSKSWKCSQPSSIVSDVLSSCVGVMNLDILSTSNPEGRDYIAEKIHPYQVVAQQANVALDGGNDPSYLHYMTYNNNGMNGTHHFRSLKNLSQNSIKKTYYAYESGVAGYQDYNNNTSDSQDLAIAFSFPCDFDLLADVLNGLDSTGTDINVLSVFNESSGLFQMLGDAMSNMDMCGRGGNFKLSRTNKGTAGQHNACETDVEKYLLKRQARMSLLEKDKVALRLVGPWDPDLHVGDVINFQWTNKYTKNWLYGSGTYIISGLNHNIQLGGFSTTTLDCVSVTAGTGIV